MEDQCFSSVWKQGCDKCYKKLAAVHYWRCPRWQPHCQKVLEGNNDGKDYLARDTSLQSLNDNLLHISELPVKMKIRGEPKYQIAKLENTRFINGKNLLNSTRQIHTRAIIKWWSRNITTVEGKVPSNYKQSELPKRRSIRKVQNELPASIYKIWKAKKLVKE
jgi:hypothetical protein